MKSFVFGSVVALLALSSAVAFADDVYRPDVSQSLHPSTPVRIGFGADVGLPSGAAVGVVVNPKLDWLRLGASLTYNYLTFGGRANVQLDPMALLDRPDRHLAFGVFGDVQGGFFPTSAIPGHSNLPGVGYDYANFMLGVRLGRPNGFHWNFEGGESRLHVNTSNFQSVVGTSVSGLTLGNPTVDGWIPCVSTGFTVVWP